LFGSIIDQERARAAAAASRTPTGFNTTFNAILTLRTRALLETETFNAFPSCGL